MDCRVALPVLPILIISLCLPQSYGASFATCKRACRSVGVQLKASAKTAALQDQNNNVLRTEMDQKFLAMTQSLEAKTKAAEISRDEQIAYILSTIQDLKTEIKHTREALCPLFFNGRCYWAAFEKDMNYSTAERVCARIPNGKPSNIYGHDHLFVVLKYLRTLVRRNQVTVYTWIGMTVDPESEKVLFTNGQAPKTVKWRENQPDFALDYTQLMIMARTDGNRKQEGLYNQNPAYEKPAVLCEA